MSANVYKVIDSTWTYSSIFHDRGSRSITKDQWKLIPKELRANIEYYDGAELNKMPQRVFPFRAIMEFQHHRDPNYYLIQYGYDKKDWAFIGKRGLKKYTKQDAIKEMLKGSLHIS